jgi:RHS repeat-associated protein
LVVAFTICSIPYFELLSAELAGTLGREVYAAQVNAASSGDRDKSADSGASSGVSVSVSRFTGTAKAYIPIVVAPGRSEATTTKLSLTYSSSRGNCWLGMARGTAKITSETGYRNTGQEYDAEMGLYWYGSWYYDPVIGRFVMGGYDDAGHHGYPGTQSIQLLPEQPPEIHLPHRA